MVKAKTGNFWRAAAVKAGPKATGGTTTKPESQLVTSQAFCSTTSPEASTGEGKVSRPVSYTHLTLPTIRLV